MMGHIKRKFFNKKGAFFVLFVLGFLLLIGVNSSLAQSASSAGAGSTIPNVNISVNGQNGEDFSLAIQTLIILTILSFGPAIITMMTSFTRLVVVFFFLRMGLGTQQSPPNQVLLGLAMFITIFIMAPTFNQINNEAIQPYLNDEITQTEALNKASIPMKEFMVKQTREKDLLLFMDMGDINSVANVKEIPLYVVIPSFVISELRIAFQIGFLIYLPFMVIDLVVASVLLSMGIMFLPPVLVSLPFKILVFVLSDGWYLLVESLIKSFS
ncbi:MAG: flagellar type III secretion system pore protein FliP [Balneolaceae bacterium]|jgi:flagellar biosynthetic protein FliP